MGTGSANQRGQEIARTRTSAKSEWRAGTDQRWQSSSRSQPADYIPAAMRVNSQLEPILGKVSSWWPTAGFGDLGGSVLSRPRRRRRRRRALPAINGAVYGED